MNIFADYEKPYILTPLREQITVNTNDRAVLQTVVSTAADYSWLVSQTSTK